MNQSVASIQNLEEKIEPGMILKHDTFEQIVKVIEVRRPENLNYTIVKVQFEDGSTDTCPLGYLVQVPEHQRIFNDKTSQKSQKNTVIETLRNAGFSARLNSNTNRVEVSLKRNISTREVWWTVRELGITQERIVKVSNNTVQIN